MSLPTRKYNLTDEKIEELYVREIAIKHVSKNLIRDCLIIVIIAFTPFLLYLFTPSLSDYIVNSIFLLTLSAFFLWFSYQHISSGYRLKEKLQDAKVSEKYISRHKLTSIITTVIILSMTAWICFFSFLEIANL